MNKSSIKTPATELLLACLAALLFLLVLGAPAALAQLPVGFQDTELELEGPQPGNGLEKPTMMRFAPDGQLFVALKSGEILLYESVADKTPTVFADLRTDVYDLGDRGLLGLALDPKFSEGRPYVYALYTYDHILGDPEPAPRWGQPNHAGDECPEPDGADDCLVSGRLVRLKDVGGEASEEKVLVEGWCQQFSSHSIGDLEFGSGGELFASGGDGASFDSADFGQFGEKTPNPCGDPPAGKGGVEEPPTAMGGSLRSQNPKLLNGKVIRISPDSGEGLEGNPLFSSANENERRIVAEGFRNPFRFTVDPSTHQLFVGNVGWGTDEEIDRFTPPVEGLPAQLYNSGWPCYEGLEETEVFSGLGLAACEHLYETPGSTSPPFFYYEHNKEITPEDPCPSGSGSAIAGLRFYEGDAYPAQYKGALFFSDPVRGCIYVMFPGENGEPDPSQVVPFLTNGGPYPGIDVEEGPEGDLYYVKLEGSAENDGSIHKISYSSGDQPPLAHLRVNGAVWGPEDEEFQFDASESSDANEGEELTYSWDLNGDGVFGDLGDSAVVQHRFNDAENHTVAVRVEDEQGESSIARITVYPGDSPPEPVISKPAETLHWSVGETIHFEGSANDADEAGGKVPTSGLFWDSRLFHCPFSGCHTHPLYEFHEASAGQFIAPEHDYPSQIQLFLTATDARGLARTTSVHLQPTPVRLRIRSNPVGLGLGAGTLSEAAPFTLTAIEGANVTLSAPKTISDEGATYAWQGWSDGGARVHTVIAKCAAIYTAEYRLGSVPNEEPTNQLEAPCDTTPPQTTIDSAPSGPTNNPTPTIAFSSSEPESSFECELDGEAYAPCASPVTLAPLPQGPHSYRVRAADALGNADPSPAEAAFRVDTSPPQTTIESGPTGTIAETTPTIAFSSSEPESSFECKLDGEAFGACASPVRLAPLADGPHSYEVRATDAAGNTDPSPALDSFTVRAPRIEEAPAREPQTKLAKHPDRHTKSTTAKFTFSASTGGARFRCKLDRGPFRTCSSPETYRHLRAGRHVFEVLAANAAGADPTPARFAWRIR